MKSLKKSVVCLSAVFSVIAIAAVSMTSFAAGSNANTMEKHYDNYKEWWLYDGSLPDIVGKEYKPDSKTKKLLDQAEKKGPEEHFSPDSEGAAEDEAFYKVVAKTPSFTVFYIGGIDSMSMIIKTASSDYLDVCVPAVSYTNDDPEYAEYDLDGDGELELIYKPTWLFHGTGYYEELMLVVDTDEKSDWKAYLINPEKYMPEIAKQVEAKYINNKATLLVNGKEEGSPVPKSDIPDSMNPGLYLENVVLVEAHDGKIWVGSKPMFDGASASGPGVIVWYPISYEGEGKYSGDKVVCRPEQNVLYQDVLDSFKLGQLYYYWRNPNLEKPLMLVSALKNSLEEDKERTYDVSVSSCEVAVMENGKLKTLETLESDSGKYPIAYSPDGLIVKDEHFIYVYGPDKTGKKIVIKDGVEDNKVSKFSKHKGYIRIRDGEAQTITKKEYDVIYSNYEDASPVSFTSR